MKENIKTPSERILSYIKASLTYDSETGIISKSGKKVGSERPKNKCIVLHLVIGYTDDGCRMIYTTYAHQVAWYLTHGVWPEKFIDHINGQANDNRIANLRLATPSQNSYNKRKLTKTTSSQYKGVRKVGSKWRAVIMSEGKSYHLGYYPTEDGAAKAYDEASIKLHGEFGITNSPSLPDSIDPAPQP